MINRLITYIVVAVTFVAFVSNATAADSSISTFDSTQYLTRFAESQRKQQRIINRGAEDVRAILESADRRRNDPDSRGVPLAVAEVNLFAIAASAKAKFPRLATKRESAGIVPVRGAKPAIFAMAAANANERK